jgi:hypothetical protein
MDSSLLYPQLVEYMPEYQLFYCHSCCSVYVLKQLDSHLKQKHAVSAPARQRLTEHCKTLPLPLAVQSREPSYRQPVRESQSLPVPFLPILEGFTCSHCHSHDPWYSTNQKAGQEHINQAHRLFRTACTTSLRPVKLQTWYSRTHAKYWEVAPATTTTATATTTPPSRATPTSIPRVASTPTLAPAPSSSPITIDLTAASQLEEVEEEEC